MEEKILEVLKLTRNNALSKDEIYKKIYHTEYDLKQYQTLENNIKELLEQNLIYCVNSKKELYTLNPFKKGTFHIKRNGECYVIADDLFISIKNNRVNAFDGDEVIVRITDFNRMEGNVKEIIDRQGVIALVKTIKKQRYAVVGKEKYKIDLDDSIVDDMLIGIKIDKEKSGNYYRCKLDKVIGHKNAPKLDEKKILYQYGIMDGFSKEALDEIKSIPKKVLEEDFKNRKDLRNKIIFTIDGDDTKDIDDAISLDILENGNYLLGVHIADVSNYVKENSLIDKEAREKGTSVYMPGVVSPMYPVFLSNGICSLNPDVDRLAITCEMELNKNGDLINFDIYKSVIHSRIQMTYNNVNKILKENVIPKGYEDYVLTLKSMEELAKILRKMRIKRGLLNFDSEEIKINVDENGEVLNVTERTQDIAENLIEDFMLIANETVATYIYNMGLNSIYRVHDLPDIEKIKKVITIIKNYGEKIDIKIRPNDQKTIQNLLDILKENKNFDIYANMILRCMAKASYKNINEGHFGIGINSSKKEAYTHFTSPIRRYPDTTIHRILSNILNGNIEVIQTELYKNNLLDIATHSSEMEIVADNVEKEANKMKLASYMSKYVGKIFEGKIVSFTYHGMFVKLDNYVEGRVGYNTMDDFYNYNEEMELLIGERKKKVYRLGDRLKVKVVKASKESREIDFEIIKGDQNGNIKSKSKL